MSCPCPAAGVREALRGCRGGVGWRKGRLGALWPGWAPAGKACSRGSEKAGAAGFQEPAARRRRGAGNSSRGRRPCSRWGTAPGTPRTGASSGAGRWGGRERCEWGRSSVEGSPLGLAAAASLPGSGVGATKPAQPPHPLVMWPHCEGFQRRDSRINLVGKCPSPLRRQKACERPSGVYCPCSHPRPPLSLLILSSARSLQPAGGS